MPLPDEPYTLPPPAANLPPVSPEVREMVGMLCRAMMMFVHWANRRYSLGMRLNDR